LLWEALKNAFEHDQSAARPAGSMACRKLIVFKHKDALGNAPAHKLFELVKIECTGKTEEEKKKPARAFSDYEVKIDKASVPAGVEAIEMV